MSGRQYASLASGGLDPSSPAMRLFQKAKRFGIWNPCDIDLTQDQVEWLRFDEREQDVILRLVALFQAGEESVAVDLLPLIGVIASERRLDEELYLASFLWEEAKHVEFMRRYLTEVCQASGDLHAYSTPSYEAIFGEALPTALQRLRTDSSPRAQAEASVVYNMIVEGVLAETGYHAIFTTSDRLGILPGLRRGMELMMQDEARHIAYGVLLLSRLVAEHPELWEQIEAKLQVYFPLAAGVITEVFDHYQPDVPFGLDYQEFLMYAMNQFERRYNRLLRAKGRGADAAMQLAHQSIDEEEISK